MLNPDGIVSNWNLGAQRFKGHEPQEIIGQHFRQIFTEKDQIEGLPERILKEAERDGRYESEGWRIRKDGQRFWAHAIVETIRDNDGQLLGFAKITRDISERHKAEEHLYRRRDRRQARARQACLGARDLGPS